MSATAAQPGLIFQLSQSRFFVPAAFRQKVAWRSFSFAVCTVKWMLMFSYVTLRVSRIIFQLSSLPWLSLTPTAAAAIDSSPARPPAERPTLRSFWSLTHNLIHCENRTRERIVKWTEIDERPDLWPVVIWCDDDHGGAGLASRQFSLMNFAATTLPANFIWTQNFVQVWPNLCTSAKTRVTMSFADTTWLTLQFAGSFV